MYVILLQVLEDTIPEVQSCGDVMSSLNLAKTAAMQRRLARAYVMR